MIPIVIKPFSYSQDSGNVRLELPADGNSPGGAVVEIDTFNVMTLLGVTLTAICMSGDSEQRAAARMLFRLWLGDL